MDFKRTDRDDGMRVQLLWDRGRGRRWCTLGFYCQEASSCTLCCASPTVRCVKVCNCELVSVTLLCLSAIWCPVRVSLSSFTLVTTGKFHDSSSSTGTTAHCGLCPVEQCPSIFFLSATNSLHLLNSGTFSFHIFLGLPLLFVPKVLRWCTERNLWYQCEFRKNLDGMFRCLF